ncbi:hypothetical protein VTK26DRAFT_1063 [Humicola hyalothermophila]
MDRPCSQRNWLVGLGREVFWFLLFFLKYTGVLFLLGFSRLLYLWFFLLFASTSLTLSSAAIRFSHLGILAGSAGSAVVWDPGRSQLCNPGVCRWMDEWVGEGWEEQSPEREGDQSGAMNSLGWMSGRRKWCLSFPHPGRPFADLAPRKRKVEGEWWILVYFLCRGCQWMKEEFGY